jgi:predicted nucleotidyltransferase
MPIDHDSLVKAIRKALPQCRAVYLFGSQAQATSRPDSDVDLAFILDTKPDADAMFSLRSELALLLRKDVDLVDLLRADSVTQAQVVAFGQVLYAEDPAALDSYEVRVFSQYGLLNEERRAILEDIEKRGSIRG